MKIRHKSPKVSRSARPQYVVGYTGPSPSLAELQAWFDAAYGGPLSLTGDREGTEHAGTSAALLVATHGPWRAAVQFAVPAADANSWKERLGWGHPQAGLVLPTTGPAGNVVDLVLLTARLARGLTLLTDGTAYDVAASAYLNPSDWRDRPLDRFLADDHVRVQQADAPDPSLDWFYTRGLVKFGLDEIETFRPVGLPSRPVLETLAGIAAELLRTGHAPKVGALVPMRPLGLSVRVLRHRTASLSGSMLPLREITWDALSGDEPDR